MADLLVGRDVEAAVLRGMIAEMPGRSAAVVVRGEAGIGKTVLVRSVLDEYAGSGVRVFSGACAPMSGATAYSGLGAIVTAALSQSTGRFSSSAAARAWSMQTLTDALCGGAEQGTVLQVEDVHWADWSTLDFLARTTRNLPEQGLLVLMTWRDETVDPERPGLARRSASHTSCRRSAATSIDRARDVAAAARSPNRLYGGDDGGRSPAQRRQPVPERRTGQR